MKSVISYARRLKPMRKNKKQPNTYTERISVGFTPEQVHRLNELARVRARKGQPQSKSDLIRDALNFFLAAQEDLPGSRRAIAKGIESKVDVVNEKLDHLTTRLEGFIERVTRRNR